MIQFWFRMKIIWKKFKRFDYSGIDKSTLANCEQYLIEYSETKYM